MRKIISIVSALTFIGGCGLIGSGVKKHDMVNTLNIRWQRLVGKSGGTCSRCELTQSEVKEAFRSLKKSLAPLGIKVVLEEEALDSATCAQDISQSNRIWIDERSLEEWLDAKVGRSPCEVCCAELGGNVECRTLTVNGNTYEEIPAELIIQAGLLSASQRLTVEQTKPCCPQNKCSKKGPSACCPK